MSTQDWTPKFQRWWESDFCGSYSVRKMPRLARLMYRCLLQAAWNTDNPPYLPNDDKELRELADAPSEGAWNEQRAVILERFQRTEGGKWLYHRKTLAEFERARSEHVRKGDAVKRRWQGEKKPSTRKAKARKTALPENFGISERVRSWATENGHDRLEERLEHFVSYAKRSGKTYADWDEALMGAIRENWAKFETSPPNGKGPTPASEIARRQQAGEEWRR